MEVISLGRPSAGDAMIGGSAAFREHDNSPYIDTGANPFVILDPPYSLENNPVDWLVLSSIPATKRKRKGVGLVSTPQVKVTLLDGTSAIYSNLTRAYKALSVSPKKLLDLASVVGGAWFTPTKLSTCRTEFHIITHFEQE